MRIPLIKGTKEYSKFKRFDSNREVNKTHLRRLVGSIHQKNLLHLFPIVVNADMEIVDGQHRLAAAMELGVPVYYITNSSVTKADIAMVNTNRKSWGYIDFVNYYRKEGVKAYKTLWDLKTKYGVPIICALRLMTKNVDSYNSGGTMSTSIKTGKIDDSDAHIAEVICELMLLLDGKLAYNRHPQFLLDLKWSILRLDIKQKQLLEVVPKSAHIFPGTWDGMDNSVRRIMRTLFSREQGHSKEEVQQLLKSKGL